jgi:hypothetical protein
LTPPILNVIVCGKILFRSFANRGFATAAGGKGKVFKPKTTAEAWLSDTGVSTYHGYFRINE